MHCVLLFTLLSTLRLVSVNVYAIAIELGSLETRENLQNDGDIFTNFDDLSPSSEGSSIWSDELDLTSVPGCNGPQSSLDSGNLFGSEDLFASSEFEDNDLLLGRGLEDFSTQLNNFAAPLKTLSNPACVNQDFQFKTPPQGNTNPDGSRKSTGQENQNPEPQAPLENLLPGLQLELEPTCPQDPFWGYIEDLCCPGGPSGLNGWFWHDCTRCMFLNLSTRPSTSQTSCNNIRAYKYMLFRHAGESNLWMGSQMLYSLPRTRR